MPTDADNVEYAIDCFVVMRYSVVVVVAEGCCCCWGMLLLLLLRVYISMRLFACIKETTRSLLDEKSTKETMAHTIPTPPYFPPPFFITVLCKFSFVRCLILSTIRKKFAYFGGNSLFPISCHIDTCCVLPLLPLSSLVAGHLRPFSHI